MNPRVLNTRKDVIPKGAVYVGRPSKWGNPYSIGTHGNRGQVIEKYRVFLRCRTDLVEDAKRELAGKSLICYCAPEPCHADVLLRVANGGKI